VFVFVVAFVVVISGWVDVAFGLALALGFGFGVVMDCILIQTQQSIKKIMHVTL
jgi:hypothetical protein